MSEQAPPVDYTAEMRAILEQPLTPGVIDRYALNALHSLVGLVTSVTIDYGTRPTLPRETAAANEDAALSYFGLPDVEGALRYIQDAESKIKALDTVVDAARRTRTVITPPDTGHPKRSQFGEVPYEPPAVVPRLKTVLFILGTTFDVDVYKPGEIELELGAVGEDMRRRHGYYFLSIPSCNRTMLICDETDNATYVFANDERLRVDLTDDALKQLTKPELDEYIKTFPGLGTRINYSGAYVDDVIAVLRDLSHQGEAVRSRPGQSFLVPNAPEDFMSVEAFGREVGVRAGILRERIIGPISDKLGKVTLYQHSAWVTDSLSPGQQATLLDELDRLGLIADPPSEDYPQATRDTMRDTFRVKRARIDSAVEALDEQLGPRGRYLYHKTRDEGFDPWQQDMIYDWLWE